MTLSNLIPWRQQRSDLARAEETHPLESFRRDMDRMIADFWRRWDGTLTDLSTDRWVPRTDVSETETSIEVAMELPGLTEDDIDITLSHDRLTISGEKRAERSDEDRGWALTERSWGAFERILPIGVDIDRDRIEARMENGVLQLTLPKTEQAQQSVRRIRIGGAESRNAA